ncbi:MAG: transcription antitermination factor NusB [Vulcanimicrobiota bacterium]
MSPRSRARVLVVSALYQIDLLGKPMARVVEEVREGVSEDPDSLYYLPERERAQALDFFESLLRGTWEHQAELDIIIQEKLDNWTLNRVGMLERAILRLGCFELLHREDIPAKVSLNEMVELSKSFCDIKSKDFINGVLDAIAP